MIKAYRLRNALMHGEITGEQLGSLLQETEYDGALYDLCGNERMARDCIASPLACAILLDTPAAHPHLFSSIPVKSMFCEHTGAFQRLKNHEEAVTYLKGIARTFQFSLKTSSTTLKGKNLLLTTKSSHNPTITVMNTYPFCSDNGRQITMPLRNINTDIFYTGNNIRFEIQNVNNIDVIISYMPMDC